MAEPTSKTQSTLRRRAKTIVTVTMVRNEIDIVETFVRYHAPIVDLMIILDNGSTDGTADVLARLIAEGLPVEVLFDDNPSFVQSEIMTRLLYQAANAHAADLVVPLDGDEFLTATSERPVRDLLDDRASISAPTEVEWITYVPVALDDLTELNPVKRIRSRRATQHNQDAKILVPGNLIRGHDITLSQGSHRLSYGSGPAPIQNQRTTELCLAHYPVRSVDQTRSKYLVGWLTNLARPEQVLFDWYPAYNRAKDEHELTIAELTELARYYDVADKQQTIDLIDAPLGYGHVDDFDLRYTASTAISPTRNVLNYAEQLARKYSTLAYSRQATPKPPSEFYTDQIILQIIHDYTLIDGWLSPAEAVALYRIAKATAPHGAALCEIGSWLGRSSYVIAKALNSKPDSYLYCVDPFDASGDAASASIYEKAAGQLGVPLLQRFSDNMQRFGTLDKIRILQGKSEVISRDFVGGLDLLFIDGDHNYASVRSDFLDWGPKVRNGGWIAFHDVGAAHTTGPKQVVEEFIVGDPMWIEQTLVEELYFARKRPS